MMDDVREKKHTRNQKLDFCVVLTSSSPRKKSTKVKFRYEAIGNIRSDWAHRNISLISDFKVRKFGFSHKAPKPFLFSFSSWFWKINSFSLKVTHLCRNAQVWIKKHWNMGEITSKSNFPQETFLFEFRLFFSLETHQLNRGWWVLPMLDSLQQILNTDAESTFSDSNMREGQFVACEFSTVEYSRKGSSRKVLVGCSVVATKGERRS